MWLKYKKYVLIGVLMDRHLLGKRLREARIRSGLTQEQTAENINVSTTYIGLVERGERSVTLEKLVLLAQCFHTTVDNLLSDSLPASESPEDTRMHLLWDSASPSEKALILSIMQSVLDYSNQK